jgi:hypothetical protein
MHPAPVAAPSESEDRRFALLLVAAALLLMLTVIAAGWLLIGRGGVPEPRAAGSEESSRLPASAPVDY